MSNPSATESFKDCDEAKISAFIKALELDSNYIRKAYFPVDEKSHFERFNYICGNDKISIVYDTKAKILSITSKTEIIQKLKNLFSFSRAEAAPQAVVQKPVVNSVSNNNEKQKKPEQKNIKSVNKKNNQNHVEPVVLESGPEYKNGYSIKNFPLERFNGVLKLIKTVSGVRLRQAGVEFAGTPEEVIVHIVEYGNKQKIYLRYMPNKQSLQMQGKPSKIFGEIQIIIYKGSDYKTAVNSYIKQTNEDVNAAKSVTGVEKQLKKLIPNAIDFLSDQSKKDLTFALIDIYNDDIKLSDYSGLLVAPYRGLERLIFDLQSAQGINVKMIGQGYEKKENGAYCLKSGYRKKINSIVYDEVMSALYTEYFEKRNFYLHSDNSLSSESRMITDKEELKKIFSNLLELINYNGQKLKEIRFSIDKTNK